jgi:hypothetical protein
VSIPQIDPGNGFALDLRGDAVKAFAPFYAMADEKHAKEMSTQQYYFRISFRNAITKEKRVLYVIASPMSAVLQIGV